MKRIIFLILLLVLYAALMVPFADNMNNRSLVEKLGFVPRPEPLRVMAADNRISAAAMLVLHTLQYFGSMSGPSSRRGSEPTDFPGMYNALTTALKLDPYNMDAYYFCQAFLVWDVGEVRAANSVLEYGMKYRTWDFYLPFFAGFNYAYFLKDYTKAACYYKRVADITGSELSIGLTGRYLHESGRTEQAIAYLKTMERATTNEAVKRSFGIRLKAFEGVRRIEIARDRFLAELGRFPTSIKELVQAGYLKGIPDEPYGGSFYLGLEGQVCSTSKFAGGWRNRKDANKTGGQQR